MAYQKLFSSRGDIFHWLPIFLPLLLSPAACLAAPPASPLANAAAGVSLQFCIGWTLLAGLFFSAAIIFLKIRTNKEATAHELLLLSQALPQGGNALLITDANATIQYGNDVFYQITGYAADEIIGRKFYDVAGHLAENGQVVRECFKSGQRWQGKIVSRKKDGTAASERCFIAPVRNRGGAITHFVVVKESITECSQTEEELRRLAFILGEDPTILMEIDLQGRITYESPACRSRFPAAGGATGPHPLLQKLETRLPHGDDRQWADFVDELDTEQGIFERHVKCHAPERLIRICAFDLTQLRKIEQELTKAKAEAEGAASLKSTFLANIGHEIRTPLNAILGYADLLMMDTTNPVVRKRLGIISTSGKNLLALIDDILDIAKIEAGRLEIMYEEFSIARTLQELEQMFAQQAAEKKIAFQVEATGAIPDRIIGDSNRLRQILVNLLSNSFKFTDKGQVTLQCSYQDGKAIFRVADTGIGISKEKQNVIFAEFQQADAAATRKYGGTGLGLSITSRLVALMNGSMSLESDSGRGAVFTVYLPFRTGGSSGANLAAAKEAQVSGKILSSVLASIGRDLRILLAEDNDMNQYLICEMLGNVGLYPVIAANGQEALARLEEAGFDLLLLDMKMPVLDGMQTIALIRAQDKWRDLHVIALTGEAIAGDKEKFLAMGCNDYLAKPLDLETLYGKIHGFVAARFPFAVNIQAEQAGQGLPSAASARLEISKELRFHIVQAIEVLKNNLKIFNPDQIRGLAASFTEFDHIDAIDELKQELLQIAVTFDDEALPQLIQKLEAL